MTHRSKTGSPAGRADTGAFAACVDSLKDYLVAGVGSLRDYLTTDVGSLNDYLVSFGFVRSHYQRGMHTSSRLLPFDVIAVFQQNVRHP